MAIPQYAAHVPREQLVKILCGGACAGKSSTTFAQLVPAPPDVAKIQKPTEKYSGFVAKCLRCGKVAADNYNWYAP